MFVSIKQGPKQTTQTVRYQINQTFASRRCDVTRYIQSATADAFKCAAANVARYAADCVSHT